MLPLQAPAGHYGNYECDLPLVTLDVVVETIAQLDPPPDFIIYTGLCSVLYLSCHVCRNFLRKEHFQISDPSPLNNDYDRGLVHFLPP